MPLLYKQHINHCTQIAVWYITENADFFEHIPLQRSITNGHKRLQHFAGRHLLFTLHPNFPLSSILIAHTKKPFLQNEAYHFSISHAGNFAAVIVSTKNRVGVDVEIVTDKALRIVPKFLSATEQALMPANNLAAYATLFWSVKEAVYKWNGTMGIDFIRDMPIVAINGTAENGTALCNFKNQQLVTVQYQFIQQQFYLCYVVT
jgi:phosphopantetheinyl transferase